MGSYLEGVFKKARELKEGGVCGWHCYGHHCTNEDPCEHELHQEKCWKDGCDKPSVRGCDTAMSMAVCGMPCCEEHGHEQTHYWD